MPGRGRDAAKKKKGFRPKTVIKGRDVIGKYGSCQKRPAKSRALSREHCESEDPPRHKGGNGISAWSHDIILESAMRKAGMFLTQTKANC